ncbi:MULTISPECIES: bactofilin family protein [unclassified Lysobacter]
MAIWKEPASSKSPAPAPAAPPAPVQSVPTPTPEAARFDAPSTREVAAPGRNESSMKESLIAADLTIEGKIEGTGHVRIAGKFNGDVNVQGNLTIETGAKLTGGVRAQKVIVAGELEGNIESAQRVEVLESGALIGDVKAGSLIVAAGSRMRGQVEFGWGDKGYDKAENKSQNNSGNKPANQSGTKTGLESLA